MLSLHTAQAAARTSSVAVVTISLSWAACQGRGRPEATILLLLDSDGIVQQAQSVSLRPRVLGTVAPQLTLLAGQIAGTCSLAVRQDLPGQHCPPGAAEARCQVPHEAQG